MSPPIQAPRRSTAPVDDGATKEGVRLNSTLKEAGGNGRHLNAEARETAANVRGKTTPRSTRLAVGERVTTRFRVAVHAGQVGKDRFDSGYPAIR
jgi:hypothetical protein